MKVILVDSHSLFRSGVTHLFDSQGDFQVVGETETIQKALSLVKTKQPELVLIDLRLKDGSGIDAISKFLEINPKIYIVFLTTFMSDELAFAAIQHGAKGFLPKDITAPALLTALRRLEKGELAVPRTILSRFVSELKPFMNPQQSAEINNKEKTLTKREIDILIAIGDGDSNAEIAERYSISLNTAKVHVHNILRKLKFKSRYEAAEYAKRIGLT